MHLLAFAIAHHSGVLLFVSSWVDILPLNSPDCVASNSPFASHCGALASIAFLSRAGLWSAALCVLAVLILLAVPLLRQKARERALLAGVPVAVAIAWGVYAERATESYNYLNQDPGVVTGAPHPPLSLFTSWAHLIDVTARNYIMIGIALGVVTVAILVFTGATLFKYGNKQQTTTSGS